MKLYLLSQASQDVWPAGPFLDALVELVADAMMPTGNESLIGVWRIGEASMHDEPFDAEYAGKRVKALTDRGVLLATLRRIADPDEGYFMWVRCQTTCRSIFFGYDAQAFLCLRHADIAPARSTLICVEDCSDLLAGSDYLDG
jgi:hypothetical protein